MGNIVDDLCGCYRRYNISLWIGEFKLEVTQWVPGEHSPTKTGGYQVRTLDKPDEIMWSYWNNGLKQWGAPHRNPRKAAIQQFLPWRSKEFEWRARV